MVVLGAESASCSFAEKVLKAVKGEQGIVEPTFVYLPGIEGGEAIAKATGVEFFSVPVELGVSFASEMAFFSRSEGAPADNLLPTVKEIRRRESHQHPRTRQRSRKEATRGLHQGSQGKR